MLLPKRFTLSTLLLVMLLVSLVFGYAQWRKQRLVREIKGLGEHWTSQIVLSDDWFWPVVRTDSAMVLFSEGNDGLLFYNGESYTIDEAKRYYADISQRIRAIGVEHVEIAWLEVKNMGHGKNVEFIVSLNGIESLDKVLNDK